MKITLREIRERHEEKQVEKGSKTSKKLSPDFPSAKNVPFLLLFRRVSYRVYPNKQIVALYHSKLLDKYLSIPFGPGGNLNLSEAVVHDTIDEAVPLAVLSGLTKLVPTVGAGLAKIGAAGAAVGAAGKAVKSGIGKYIANKLAQQKQKEKPTATTVNNITNVQTPKKKPTPKTGSSWSTAKNITGSTFQTKLNQAVARTGKPAFENKISDLRKMINENQSSMDLIINEHPVTINTSMAKRIVETYDSMNKQNKQKLVEMLNTDMESFKKLINFTIKK